MFFFFPLETTILTSHVASSTPVPSAPVTPPTSVSTLVELDPTTPTIARIIIQVSPQKQVTPSSHVPIELIQNFVGLWDCILLQTTYAHLKK